jgi:hypothetical protein
MSAKKSPTETAKAAEKVVAKKVGAAAPTESKDGNAVSKGTAAKELGTAMEYVEDFNHRIKVLTMDLYERHKNDATIYRAKARIMTAIDVSPLFVLGAVGEYLYKFREEIYAGDDKFFLSNDYDDEMKAAVKQEKADLSKYIIPKVKEAWKTLSETDKTQYKENVIALLDDYVEYKFLTLDASQPKK